MKMQYGTKGFKEGFDRTPVGIGRHLVKVSRVFTETKSGEEIISRNGHKMIKVVLEVLSGASAGRTIWDQLVLLGKNDKGAGITKHKMKVIGVPYNEKTQEFDIDTDIWPDLNPFYIDVIHQDYNGALSSKIDAYIRESDAKPNGFGPKEEEVLEDYTGESADKEVEL